MQYKFLIEMLTCFMGSFLLTYFVIPKIIGVAIYKQLMDKPNIRSSHINQIPNLGGISFYITYMFGIYFLSKIYPSNFSSALILSLLILFFVGLKDDLVILSPVTKLIAQSISVSIILFESNFHVTNLHGLFGIHEISIFISLPFSMLIMLTIINSFNLIDGIDGLAASIGIFIFSCMGVIFYFLEMNYELGICFIIVGSLIAFLRYNMSVKQKIFMGDTGSLIIGFLIATIIIRLLAIDDVKIDKLPFLPQNLLLVIISILIVPLFDTLRVFLIRLSKGISPLKADRNHIHHILIDYMKLSHRKSTFFISIGNSIFTLLLINLCSFFNSFIISIVLIIIVTMLFYLFNKMNFSNLKSKKNSN
jgi:UDP-GlcNAc:undecaprenyl-phosphate GlcNAc-1-phosphate transferase